MLYLITINNYLYIYIYISNYKYFYTSLYSTGQNYITFQFFEHNFCQNASNALKIL